MVQVAMSPTEAEELNQAADEIEARFPTAAALLRRQGAVSRTEPDDFLSPQEVAELLGVTAQTVRNWVDRGWLESRRIGVNRRQIPRTALAAVVEFRTSRRVANLRGVRVDETEVTEIVREHRARRSPSRNR